MATQLKNIVAFTVGAGGTVIHPHGLNQAGLALVPDFVIPDVGGLTITADATNITAHNATGASITANVLVEHWHSFERAFGARINVHLNPQPLVVNAGSAGGGGGSAVQSFRYVANGTETTAGFLITIPNPLANTNYNAIVAIGDAIEFYTLNAPPSGYALNQFLCIPSANPQNGDILLVLVAPLT